ncbi:MAG: RusA family crossover junction endodeoxyribonuclease [Acidobacteriota bacterium]
MEEFEFVIEGPAVSLKAKKTNARRYQKWIRTVRAAAQSEFRSRRQITSQNIIVSIANYYTLSPPDVDNIIKPLLDAMGTVVYDDDSQVRKVISEKVDLTSTDSIQNPSPLLATALEKYSEVLHIIVTWDAED